MAFIFAQHYAAVRRAMAHEEGFEWPDLTPEQMRDAETDWHVFPNQVFLVTQGSVLGYRIVHSLTR